MDLDHKMIDLMQECAHQAEAFLKPCEEDD